MIVYLANKTRFREDILSNRIEEIVHDSFKGVLGKTVGARRRRRRDRVQHPAIRYYHLPRLLRRNLRYTNKPQLNAHRI